MILADCKQNHPGETSLKQIFSFKENPQTALKQPLKPENFSALPSSTQTEAFLSSLKQILSFKESPKKEKAAVDKLGRFHRSQSGLNEAEV